MGNFYGTVIFATFGICIGLFAYIIRPAIIEKTVMDMRKYELYLKPLNSTQIANCLMDNRCIDVIAVVQNSEDILPTYKALMGDKL